MMLVCIFSIFTLVLQINSYSMQFEHCGSICQNVLFFLNKRTKYSEHYLVISHSVKHNDVCTVVYLWIYNDFQWLWWVHYHILFLKKDIINIFLFNFKILLKTVRIVLEVRCSEIWTLLRVYSVYYIRI